MPKTLLILLILTCSLIPNWNQIKHLGQYQVHFLDIGQGDSILIRTPSNCTIFIDGGPGNTLTDNLYKYLPATERKIDLMVLSHPHLDHMQGLINLLNRYQVDNLFTTGVPYQSSFYTEFTRLSAKTNIHYPTTGQNYQLCGLEIQTIYPSKPMLATEIENVNNASIVLKIRIKDTWFYFSGDAEIEAETEIIEQDLNLKADIMKAGHHGSQTSNSLEMLQKVQPKELVIQSGEGNTYNHPHFKTIQSAYSLGIKVRRNDLEGTVSYYF